MKKPKTRAMRKRNFLMGAYIILLSLIILVSLSALLTQTAFATTYVINDGDRVVSLHSPEFTVPGRNARAIFSSIYVGS